MRVRLPFDLLLLELAALPLEPDALLLEKGLPLRKSRLPLLKGVSALIIIGCQVIR